MARMDAKEKQVRSLQSRVDSLGDSKRKYELDRILLGSSNPEASAYYNQQVISIENEIAEKEQEIKRLRTTPAEG